MAAESADAKKWIVEWLGRHAPGGAKEVAEHTDRNYFEKGWIDSLSFISFISDLEAEFSITFSNKEFQERSFATIDGLVEILKKKHGHK